MKNVLLGFCLALIMFIGGAIGARTVILQGGMGPGELENNWLALSEVPNIYNLINKTAVSEDITAAKKLTQDNCGSTYYLNAATGAAVTLPSPKNQCDFKFFTKLAFATTDWTGS